MRAVNDVAVCPVCRGRSFSLLHAATFEGNSCDAAKYFLAQRTAVAHGRIVRCCSCSFVLTSPQFPPATYQEIYRRAKGSVEQFAALLSAEKLRGKRLASIVSKHWQGTGRILDFGCGNGGFLAAMEGFDRVGFEGDGSKVDSQREPYSIVTGDFLEMIGRAPLAFNTFDLITAWDVLEHLPGPDAYVEGWRNLLKPNGILCVSVPNIESIAAHLTAGRWNSFLLEHLWYFSSATLARFMSNHGFELVAQGPLLYDAPLGHLLRRVMQTYGLRATDSCRLLDAVVIPLPVGLIYGVWRFHG